MNAPIILSERDRMLIALRAWIAQRPGLEFGNYGDVSVYRAELRSITRDLHDARTLLQYVEARPDITADMLREAFRSAYSGRLSWHYCPHGLTGRTQCGICKRVWCAECEPAPSALCHWCHGNGGAQSKPGTGYLEYCTGQYWPTEYRRAACAVLASAIWDYWREDIMPPRGTEFCVPSLGDALRARGKRIFGARIQRRWFN